MPWHQVVIKHSNDEIIEHLSIQRLIVPFIGMIRKRRAVGAFQDDIEVWLCLDDGRDRIYYFSPKAAEIAIAGNIFREFNASVCSKKPDLEGYRKIVFELPS
jgi:hypothetical protein